MVELTCGMCHGLEKEKLITLVKPTRLLESQNWADQMRFVPCSTRLIGWLVDAEADQMRASLPHSGFHSRLLAVHLNPEPKPIEVWMGSSALQL